jgi:hypothetical protein
METVPDTARARTRLCRTWMRRASLLAAAMAGVALLAAACGGSSPGSSQGGQHKSAVAYAACMRSHGITNFPDPNSQGGHNASNLDMNTPQFGAAQKACRNLLPAGDQTTTNSALSPRQLAQLLKFAKCMRAHGITNFPDPTSKGLSLGNGVDPSSPQFKAAGQACQSLLPNSAGGTHSQTGGSGGGS